MVSSKEVLDHLLLNVLELEEDEAKAIRSCWIRTYGRIKNLSHANLIRDRDAGKMSTTVWQIFTDWVLYVQDIPITEAAVMKYDGGFMSNG